jgi:hypothetical protein
MIHLGTYEHFIVKGMCKESLEGILGFGKRLSFLYP